MQSLLSPVSKQRQVAESVIRQKMTEQKLRSPDLVLEKQSGHGANKQTITKQDNSDDVSIQDKFRAAATKNGIRVGKDVVGRMVKRALAGNEKLDREREMVRKRARERARRELNGVPTGPRR